MSRTRPAPDYSVYRHLLVERRANGVVLITLNRPQTLNSANIRLHWEMGAIWKDIDADPMVKVAVVTGAGEAFSAGGDFDMVESMSKDIKVLNEVFKDTRDLVHNMINCDKPIIAAVNGVAVGAGMVVAMLSDISIVSERAKFNDGHIRLGVAAGDHACCVLPLLMGMARTKYYVLTGQFITARDADRFNMISELVAHEQVLTRALAVADMLANGPQTAIRHTKRALNQHLRQVDISSFIVRDVCAGGFNVV